MTSALFTALALIAAGQAGNVTSGPAATHARSTGTNESPAPMQSHGRAATAEHRRNG
jgi:hypothetical protein